MDAHWAPVRLQFAEMTDDELQEKIDWACDEDRHDLSENGIDLDDHGTYSTTHRLYFALEEQEQRQRESAHARLERLAALKKTAKQRPQ